MKSVRTYIVYVQYFVTGKKAIAAMAAHSSTLSKIPWTEDGGL